MESIRLGARRVLSPRAGFTLVEMLVVIAIMGVITAVIVTSQSSFNKSLVLANTAYDIALSLRNTQVYGIASRGNGAVSNTGYGLDFTKASPSTFTFFADSYPAPSSTNCHGLPANGASSPDALPGNCVYDSGNGEKVQTYTLGNGVTVSDFCALSGASWSCANSHGNGLSSLDIVFTRPNAVPFISTNGAYSSAFPLSAACVALTSPQGGARYVSVALSGEITASAPSCP